MLIFSSCKLQRLKRERNFRPTCTGSGTDPTKMAPDTRLDCPAFGVIVHDLTRCCLGVLLGQKTGLLPVPDHTALSRRGSGLPVHGRGRIGTGEPHLIVDSTGLKSRGAGEWLFEKHGTAKRRSWRKLHIGIDADNGEIVAFDLTDKEVDDALHVAPLLDQLAGAPASFMGDGAYDRACVLEGVLARNPNAKFIVPPCKGAVTGPTAATSPTQRDQHVLAVDAHERMNWQKTSGYNRRSKVEASISRYKRVIGDALKSREDARRVTEVAIAIKSLNRMRRLGQANFVRVA